jgi:hypothetical protein
MKKERTSRRNRMRIDREKLRTAVCRMDNDHIRSMLSDVIGLLPPAKLEKLAGQYLDCSSLQAPGPACADLPVEVKAFEKASRAGKYYEGFDVNSKNYMEVSGGTRAWIAECGRLLDRCVKASGKGNPAETCDAFERMFALLARIDECMDDIVFFADEGGSWQVGVDWPTVFPAWFACLAAVAEPDEYARRVVDRVDRYARYDRDIHLTTASSLASAALAKALTERTSWKKVRKTKGGR